MDREDDVKKQSSKGQRTAQDNTQGGSFHLMQNETKSMAMEYTRILGCDIDPCIDQRTTVKACDSYVIYRRDKKPVNLCDPVELAMLELAQVQFFFEHDFEDKTYSWAYLSTFDKVKMKKGFLVANTRSSQNRLILKGLLSKAIITAQYGCKVYFINVNTV